MRVGILVSHPIQYCSPWFRALAKQIDLHVFYAHQPTPRQQGADFDREFSWDIDLLGGYEHSFLFNRARDPGTHHFFGCDTPQIASIIQNGSFDVFVVFGWFLKCYWQATRACKRLNIPVLVRCDSILNTRRSPFHKAGKEIAYRIGLRQFDGFLSVGKRNADYLKHYGIPSDRIFFTPHFVDNDWFALQAAQSRSRRTEIRKEWGVGEATLVVVYAGKFTATKRVIDFLKAVQFLHEQNANVLALLIGAGELEGELRKFSEVHQLPVGFEGFRNQTELPKYYSSADVLVLPSGGETWGLVVNEAMACGLPAIVSEAVGCAPDLIDEGTTGFTFPTGDYEALAAQLAEVGRRRRDGFDFAARTQEKVSKYSVSCATASLMEAVTAIDKRANRL